MLTNLNPTDPVLASYGARIGGKRARDPYFDALCENYQALDHEIEQLSRATTSRDSADIERLRQKRASYLDTILFLLEDSDGISRHAA